MDQQIDEIVTGRALVVPEASDEPALPTRLAPEHLAYHAYVCEQAQTVPALEQQVREIQAQIAEIQGGSQSWLRFLQPIYDLADRDQVRKTGEIVRVGEAG